MKKIYLIKRIDAGTEGHDEYYAHIVCATSEEKVLTLTDEVREYWKGHTITQIGIALADIEIGIVLSDFNAG